jgi:hypothetical protein
MSRERLPNRRPALTFEFEHYYPVAGPRVFTATVGFYPDGRAAEVFVNLVNGTDKKISVDTHDAAVLLSLALQHGAGLHEMGSAMLRGSDGRAHGFMGSLLDALAGEVPDAPVEPSAPPAPPSPVAQVAA